ncbi:GDP-mannose 4,6-dehydratase [Pseudodesulfovibrio sp.]|uniref:NAD-dependent epimerase/dehydratase family protein n=1 Tax=Pseudodesulfovibrio sp. TaxID=2035812 RepID=UPI0026168061|nr:GDP-mannose 4,6-dehydratase [Pseudodesulfovibrio sp.]MDD3313175.1 GDP-mannose 4,6-dehydratase [Pseudodesulfovibrio sp.]
MSEKIVVIGSNSFSGASFVDYCLGEGVEVIGMSRSDEPAPEFLPYKKRQDPAFTFMKLDLNHDLDRMIEVMEAEKPDYVVNFAAQSMVGESWAHPEHWFQTNAVATVCLHDRLRKLDFLKKYVHISTPEVYGTCEGLIAEHTNYHPSTPYAVSRAAGDMSLMSFYNAYGFPVVFTRAANVYGPGQQLYRIIPRTVLFFLTGRKLQLHGGGHSVRSFIHIRDVSDGTLKIARNAPPPEIYHLSTTRNISIRALVEMIAERLGVDFNDHVEVVGERLGKDAAYLLDATKARETLGWADRISLEEGIDETIAWVRENLDALKSMPMDYIHKP